VGQVGGVSAIVTEARFSRHTTLWDRDDGVDPPALQPGTMIAGKLRILRLLGAGGMGSVYEVEHQSPSTVRGSSSCIRSSRPTRT